MDQENPRLFFGDLKISKHAQKRRRNQKFFDSAEWAVDQTSQKGRERSPSRSLHSINEAKNENSLLSANGD